MRREAREQYYEEEQPQAGWREPERYREEENFGSPHDQGEHPSAQYRRRRPQEDQRGYDRRGQEQRQYGGSASYREPYRENWGRDPDYYGYRPEPRFEGQYRESYRQPYREERDRGPGEGQWREEREYGPAERGAWEGPERSERGGYREEHYRPRDEGRGYRGERGGPQDYNRREPMRQEERRGLEEYYGGQEGSEFRRERPFRGETRPPQYDRGQNYEQRRERSYESRPQYEAPRGRSGPSRGRDEAGQYEEWLEEHQGRDRGTEGDRQLEGLREEHRHHHSDERYEEENRERQPRSQRRFEQGDEQEEHPGSRATQVRSRASSQSKPRTTARSGRSK
jgi:hypothetical protein